MNTNYIFTSESVTEGHPDKICDQISDAILSRCLSEDKHSRVACECFAGKDFLLVSGEITTLANIDYEKIVRDTIRRIGYTNTNSPFNADNVNVILKINTQSPDIALGVDVGGAGDQGIMFGYACKETPELMPAPIQYAHTLAKKLANVRRTTEFGQNYIMPDGKTQVSIKYEIDDQGNRIPVKVDTVVMSTQHAEFDKNFQKADLKYFLYHEVILPVFEESNIDCSGISLFINPTGNFVIGGPEGDTGLTGRKIIVDTYGGMGRHGGGCFSGKDPTKVDRSAAYIARHIAKSIVNNGYADRCEVQLAYAIGVNDPVSIYVDTFNTGKCSNEELVRLIRDNFDLTPSGIIKYLGLLDVNYESLAAYGHMGRVDLGVSWEKTKKF